MKYCGLVSDVSYPFTINGKLSWRQCHWSVEEWQKHLMVAQDTKFPCRKGHNYCSQEPQWERTSSIEYLSIKELFLEMNSNFQEEKDFWLYFDYKHLSECFKDLSPFKGLTWDIVGYPEKGASDSTIWIGTKGAHTPCHYDSYGFNVIAQLFGRKNWILFPPEEVKNLKPTRVPYEESSIYSGMNFFCGCTDFGSLKTAYMVTLNPGDILYVPKGWWHYVENLTPAISINCWIPLESDDESRLDESLVKSLITLAIREAPPSKKVELLNPNEDDLNPNVNFQELNWCLNDCKKKQQFKNRGKSVSNAVDIEIDPVPQINLKGLSDNLKAKCFSNRKATSIDIKKKEDIGIEELINAFCHPEVISLVKKKLLDCSTR